MSIDLANDTVTVLMFVAVELFLVFIVLPRVIVGWLYSHLDELLSEAFRLMDEMKAWDVIRNHIVNGLMGGKGGRPPSMNGILGQIAPTLIMGALRKFGLSAGGPPALPPPE